MTDEQLAAIRARHQQAEIRWMDALPGEIHNDRATLLAAPKVGGSDDAK